MNKEEGDYVDNNFRTKNQRKKFLKRLSKKRRKKMKGVN